MYSLQKDSIYKNFGEVYYTNKLKHCLLSLRFLLISGFLARKTGILALIGLVATQLFKPLFRDATARTSVEKIKIKKRKMINQKCTQSR